MRAICKYMISSDQSGSQEVKPFFLLHIYVICYVFMIFLCLVRRKIGLHFLLPGKHLGLELGLELGFKLKQGVPRRSTPVNGSLK